MTKKLNIKKIKSGDVLDIGDGRQLLNGLKLMARKTKRQNKYGAKKVKVPRADGSIMVFDSMKEYRRWLHLSSRELAGEINGLRRQVVYRFYHDDIKICEYWADFVYNENKSAGPSINPPIWEEVVEDVKGMRRESYIDDNGHKKTRSNPAYEMFLLKKKMMLAFFKINVVEI